MSPNKTFTTYTLSFNKVLMKYHQITNYEQKNYFKNRNYPARFKIP